MKIFFLRTVLRAAMTAVSVLLVSLPANAGEKRQLDAHEHGVTEVNMALEGDSLFIELESPAMNIVGFEHPPRTDEQKQAIVSALNVLKTDQSIFAINPEARCSPADVTVEHIVDDEHEEHADHEEHHDDDEHEEHVDDQDAGRHAEFVGQLRFHCEQPEKLTRITVGLFAAFPLTEEVEVSFLGPNTQTFFSLDAGQSEMRLDR